jgi:hypothetical protein
MHEAGWDGARAASELGVSETWVSKLRRGAGEFSRVMQRRIEELERLHLRQLSELEETSAKFSRSGPGSSPAPAAQEPTITELRALFDQVAEEAQRVPGGIFNLTRALRRFRIEYLADEAAGLQRGIETAEQTLARLKREVAAARLNHPSTGELPEKKAQ